MVLFHESERRLAVAGTSVGCIRDRFDPALVVHTLSAKLCFRMFAIAFGYEDGYGCDAVHTDPLFMLDVDRARENGRPVCSKPTEPAG